MLPYFEIMVIGLDGYTFLELNINDKLVIFLDAFRGSNGSIIV